MASGAGGLSTTAKVTMASRAGTMEARHDKWMAEHGRTYKDAAEKARRFRVFKANVDLIDRSNAAGTSATASPPTASPTSPTPSSPPCTPATTRPIPSRRRHRRQEPTILRLLLGLLDVAAVEGIHQITTGELVSLSEQQLLDCADNGGCTGGSLDNAFQYMANSGGVTTEAAYAYQGAQGACQFDASSSASGVAATISGYQRVNTNDEGSLAAAVASQPVSVAIEGSGAMFRHYGSGVFTADSCGTKLDHAVAVVGYGAEADGSGGGGYWIIKNSWGTTWGDGGYMKLEKDVGSQGACGVAMAPSYPVVSA
uniref:Peptidase C1A papain C-terminal domain-containing protein n=1 Tax=Oryza glumipatula TaxID=40148 RepID=A0A0E0AF29_9ORYZ